MSTSYDSSVVLGFKVEVRKAQKTVKKFDEDTGKPYEKKVDGDWELWYNKKVIANENSEDYDHDYGQYKGIDLHRFGYDNNERILGVILAAADCETELSEINVWKHEADIEEMKSSLTQEFGDPKLYLIFSFG